MKENPRKISLPLWHQDTKKGEHVTNMITHPHSLHLPQHHHQICNIPSFQISEKSEKFKTFSNYMYFTLKRKLPALHASFSLDCICLHLIVQKD